MPLDEEWPTGWPGGWPEDGRTPVQCPLCALRGWLRRRYGFLVVVSHQCGGPWRLVTVQAAHAWTNSYRVVLYGPAAEAAMAAWGVDDSAEVEVGHVPGS